MEVIGNEGNCSDDGIPSKVINGCFSTGDHHPMICLHVQSVCCTAVIVVLSKSRGHKVMLVMEQCKLGITKFLFSQRTTNESNIILSMDCVNADSVNMFNK